MSVLTLLPISITLSIIAISILTSTIIALLLGKSWYRVFKAGALLGTLAFIPSCTSVMYIVNHFRYGTFHYDDKESIDSFEAKGWIPNGATDITLNAHATGFDAKFAISKQELEKWFDAHWAENAELSSMPRERAQDYFTDPPGPHTKKWGWPALTEPQRYVGPIAERGSGFTIWYSEKDGIAYEDAGYW